MGCGVYIMGFSELGMPVKIPFVFALPSIVMLSPSFNP